jgi:hypothetical protein
MPFAHRELAKLSANMQAALDLEIVRASATAAPEIRSPPIPSVIVPSDETSQEEAMKMKDSGPKAMREIYKEPVAAGVSFEPTPVLLPAPAAESRRTVVDLGPSCPMQSLPTKATESVAATAVVDLGPDCLPATHTHATSSSPADTDVKKPASSPMYPIQVVVSPIASDACLELASPVTPPSPRMKELSVTMVDSPLSTTVSPSARDDSPIHVRAVENTLGVASLMSTNGILCRKSCLQMWACRRRRPVEAHPHRRCAR